MAFDFGGKVAVVTGGGSGIGLALAQRLAAEGAQLAIADINATRLAEVTALLPDALAVEADIADPAQADAFAARTTDRFGGAHIVCANAGIVGPTGAPLWEIPAEQWQRVVDVNLHGTINTLRSFMPWVLRTPPGHVCITSSMAGLTASPSMPAYFATKHALVSVAESLRLQLQRDEADVGVSVLLPARVTTHLGESLTDGSRPNSGVTESHSRELTPADVADRTIGAIHRNELYAFTHPETIDRVRTRNDALLNAFQALRFPAQQRMER